MKQTLIALSPSTVSLLLLSGLCLILLSVRYFFTLELLGVALLWNLFLAWVPLLFALIARRHAGGERALYSHLFIGAWLLFFPNAPYIITDLIHLDHLPAHLWWYDTLGIFMVAFTGLLLGIYSLSIIHNLLESYWGRVRAWAMVLMSITLSGFGIYLGRFSRFNSWDLFTDPVFLLRSSVHEALNPLAIKLTLVFTLVLSVLYISFRNLNIKTDERN
ncbi:MAG: putative membrane protein [Arcticibacterium sp.]|jgi:uncharacterized membrane protein